MAKITRINPEGISKPFANYSHVVTAEGAQKLVFCAGQVAADADGKVLAPDDFDAQAAMVMANLANALAAGGAKISDVVKVTIYICNPHDVPKARRVLQTYFAVTRPAARRASSTSTCRARSNGRPPSMPRSRRGGRSTSSSTTPA